MTSKISGQWEYIWYGYKRTFHGFEKAEVLYSVEKCSDNLVVPILHQTFKHGYDQEKYLVLRGKSEVAEFIPGGYAPISKQEATLS